MWIKPTFICLIYDTKNVENSITSFIVSLFSMTLCKFIWPQQISLWQILKYHPLYRHPLLISFVYFLSKTIAALSTVNTDRDDYVLHCSKRILCYINHEMLFPWVLSVLMAYLILIVAQSFVNEWFLIARSENQVVLYTNLIFFSDHCSETWTNHFHT